MFINSATVIPQQYVYLLWSVNSGSGVYNSVEELLVEKERQESRNTSSLVAFFLVVYPQHAPQLHAWNARRCGLHSKFILCQNSWPRSPSWPIRRLFSRCPAVNVVIATTLPYFHLLFELSLFFCLWVCVFSQLLCLFISVILCAISFVFLAVGWIQRL